MGLGKSYTILWLSSPSLQTPTADNDILYMFMTLSLHYTADIKSEFY